MRKYALVVAFSILVLTGGNIFAAGGDMGGAGQDGSADYPYLIEDFNDFQVFRSDPNYWASGVYTQLTVDIDLSTVGAYSQAPIAGDTTYDTYHGFDGTTYAGNFDGKDHVISNLTVNGGDYCGLFGKTDLGSEIKDLELENITIYGSGNYVGGLTGLNHYSSVTSCYSTGTVTGSDYVGGLVGNNNAGNISNCYSTGSVTGDDYVSILVGYNGGGRISNCYSIGSAAGDQDVGGLIGRSGGGIITNSYSTGSVTGNDFIGGLMGYNDEGSITNCYSIGDVSGIDDYIGGLVGLTRGSVTNCYSAGTVTGDHYVGGLVGLEYTGSITNCFWDTETSGTDIAYTKRTGDYPYVHTLIYSTEDVAKGLTTDQMQTLSTFTDAGWTLADYQTGLHGWYIPTDSYPLMYWQNPDAKIIPDITDMTVSEVQTSMTIAGFTPGNVFYVNSWQIPQNTVTGLSASVGGYVVPSVPIDIYVSNGSTGDGSEAYPYEVASQDDLNSINDDLDAHYKMTADIYMGYHITYTTAVIARDTSSYQDIKFTGSFEGNGYTVTNLTISGGTRTALFGYIDSGGEVKNLNLKDCDITGGNIVGSLVSDNSGNIINCHSTGGANGSGSIGGLVGYNTGSITNCHSISEVNGSDGVGGLVGHNQGGNIANCYSTGNVNGTWHYIGGLVGYNYKGNIINCYSTCDVNGIDYAVGGLVGLNSGSITNCYSTGAVTGGRYVGGLVGHSGDSVKNSFWDKETSGQLTSSGGEPRTTVKMKNSSTFIGWNDGSWTIDQGNDYPHLTWENATGLPITTDYPNATYSGSGTENNPFILSNVADLLCMSRRVVDWSCYFTMSNDIDMTGVVYVPVAEFTGNFIGGGYIIRNLTIDSEVIGNTALLGLFGKLTGNISNLGIENIAVTGGSSISGLVGYSSGGSITNCYLTGSVTGNSIVGGLVGENDEASINNCYSTTSVTGGDFVGGLVGYESFGSTTNCYSTGAVTGDAWIGGLLGYNHNGSIIYCYSTGAVTGNSRVGGLVGDNYSYGINSCFWDVQTSGQTRSDGGTGLTTAQMKSQSTFMDAGWDFVDGWWINDGRDYPKLGWQPFGDLNNDSWVNMYDFAVMLMGWQAVDGDLNFNSVCELSGDDTIDESDLAELVGMWLEGPQFSSE